jgi:tRNA A37 methylthiotransferase MiaB
VGLSFTYLSQIIPGLTLARALKLAAPELPLVVGGSYLTAVGDQAPQIPPEVLCAEVILHDGEAALDRWLSSTLRRAPANGADLRCVDLATVPSPCWIADGLDLSRYLVPRYAIPLPLTRGCHWGRCRYCNISAQTSSSYRARPIELAIADVRHAMVETGSDWFDLPTDSFRLDHLDHFARELVAQKLTVRWAAEVLMHPALTTEVIGRLARSGCCCLRFGMESASAQVLTAMNKPRPADLASRILRDCRAAGIRTSVMLIVGYPTETAHQRMETFEFLADHAACIDFVALHEFNLVPGSPMAADPSQFGLIALPSASVLAPALPYRNTNLVGLAQEHVHHAATAMRDALRDYYPQLGKPWAVAIGGWMTFAWCCLGAT